MESLRSSDADGEYVEEQWVLIVTIQPADFGDYEQRGAQDANPTETEDVARAMKMGMPKLDDDWTVIRRSIRVFRPRAASSAGASAGASVTA
jgi:hypothetical protein